MNVIDYNVYTLSAKEKQNYVISAYIGIFVFTYLFYQSVPVSLVLGLFAFRGTEIYSRHKAQSRREQLKYQFRDLLYSLSASMAAGRSLAEGLREARENLQLLYKEDAPMLMELNRMVTSIFENRQEEKSVLKDFADRSGCEDIRSFVDVYFACRSTGGNMEWVIAKTSEVLMDKLAIEKEIKVLTAQKKVEGRIITALPLSVIFILNLIAPEYLEVMYTTLTGRLVMTVALGGMIYAYVLIVRYTKIEV